MSRIACLVLILGFLVLLGTSSLAIAEPASAYPRILISGAIIALAITAWREMQRPDGIAQDAELASLSAGPSGGRLAFLTFVVVWLAYPFAMNYLGFILTTVLALVLSSLILGSRRLVAVAASAIVFAVVFAFLLKTVIYVPMPLAWPDRLLDQAIYRARSV